MELAALQGVGKARLAALNATGIFSLRDLLFSFPLRYKDAGSVQPLCQAQAGEYACFSLRRAGEPKLLRLGKSVRVTSLWEDDTGKLTCCWFNQPWMKQALMKRTRALIYGRVERYGGQWQMVNPSLEEESRIIPVYRPMEGVPQKVHESLTRQALAYVEEACPETLPQGLRQAHGLMGRGEAVRALHAPRSMGEVNAARRRIAFEQMLLYQAAVRRVKGLRKQAYPMEASLRRQEDYWARLPFTPTGAQRRTLAEIARDMASETAMGRMVQGDVGCGKTAIALGAMELCIRSGYQAALMAPTEILARQHYESARPFFQWQGIACGLLTGGMPAQERREALARLAGGEWQAVIGTHALISRDVAYRNLGLCVTDEQHRFGVGQRTALLNKGLSGQGEGARAPHLLVMSATPIPRTLALAMFGDLDVSVVDELPPGRLPITTRIVPEGKREGMYAFLREKLEAGRQAYIVCPLVEESEAMEALKAVTTHVAELAAGPLKGFALGLTHGKQPPAEKERTIQAFAQGKLQVLVATTVIEVGVNVPNATLMIIEDADRYGLAQLHQLRGRVGRGAEQSWCFLLAKENERLRALTKTNDGFVIAQKDLELRGPGEILGTQQHGMSPVAGALLFGDMALLYEAAQCVEEMESDPAQSQVWEELQLQAEQYLGDAAQRVSMS
ncbi:MAG: ATP-dependent DNA helicase RecG [Candidatus Limiplasma sp.]|nr:ATP-dependent DNA helicase RecG [Candidatus Limiplasma sp.]